MVIKFLNKKLHKQKWEKIFRVLYSAVHEENFRKAVSEGNYKKAKEVLEKMPLPNTPGEKISYRELRRLHDILYTFL